MKLLLSFYKSATRIVPKAKILSIINSVLIFLLPKPARVIKIGSIALVGMLRSYVGLGQIARLTINALLEQNYKIVSFDVSHLFVKDFLDVQLPKELSLKQEGGVIIIHNSPIHIPAILFLLGRKRIKNKKIIAYSVWETESIPNDWVKPCKLIHEIWTPSDFSAQAFRSKIKNIPIKVVPHPLRTPPNIFFDRKHFGLPAGIIILNIADLSSSFNRKNIFGTIETFRKIAHKTKNITMVLKLSGSKKFVKERDEVDRLIAALPNVLIIDKFLSEDEIQGLIKVSDIIVSLHRSEGFGLLMAEAMWHGKAILATPWSGNMTFLPKNCACYVKYSLVKIDDTYKSAVINDSMDIYKNNGVWAEPDIDDAAVKLLNLINDKKLRNELGTNAKKYAMKFFTKEAFAKQTDESLKKYAEKI